MLTYTSSRNLFGTLTNNSSTANLAVGDTLINAAIREVLRSRNWHKIVHKTLQLENIVYPEDVAYQLWVLDEIWRKFE